GQRQVTPGQHGDQAVLTQGTDQAIEGHGRDMADGGTPCQAEAAVGGDQGLAGDLRAPAAIEQDEVRQHSKHGVARGALDTPDGEITEADTRVMGVPRQTPAAGTGRLVGQLEADREKKGEDTFHEGFAIVIEQFWLLRNYAILHKYL